MGSKKNTASQLYRGSAKLTSTETRMDKNNDKDFRQHWDTTKSEETIIKGV